MNYQAHSKHAHGIYTIFTSYGFGLAPPSCDMIHDHIAAATEIKLTATSGATRTTLKGLAHVVAMIVARQADEIRAVFCCPTLSRAASEWRAAQGRSDSSFGDVSRAAHVGPKSAQLLTQPDGAGRRSGAQRALSCPQRTLSTSPAGTLLRASERGPPAECHYVNGRLWRWTLRCLSLGQRAPCAPWETIVGLRFARPGRPTLPP